MAVVAERNALNMVVKVGVGIAEELKDGSGEWLRVVAYSCLVRISLKTRLSTNLYSRLSIF
jgi:hypothetical protein